MEDEFLVYMKDKINDRLIMSFDHTNLLLWGTRTNDSVKILGLTLNIGVEEPRTFRSKGDGFDTRVDDVLHVASLLSQRSNSRFFVIVYSTIGDSSFRVTDPSDPLNWSKGLEVDEGKMSVVIQEFFKTTLESKGTSKAVNRATSDWFHDWARENIPEDYVRTNIDGLILDKKKHPTILLETKRSFQDPYSWKPYKEDSRNYYLQYLLATKSDLSFWTVYHKKGESVDDRSKIALLLISGVSLNVKNNWINYHRSNTNASEVMERV